MIYERVVTTVKLRSNLSLIDGHRLTGKADITSPLQSGTSTRTRPPASHQEQNVEESHSHTVTVTMLLQGLQGPDTIKLNTSSPTDARLCLL